MVEAEKFAQALFEGSVEGVKKLTQELLDRGERAENILVKFILLKTIRIIFTAQNTFYSLRTDIDSKV